MFRSSQQVVKSNQQNIHLGCTRIYMKFGGVYWLLVTLYGLYESEKNWLNGFPKYFHNLFEKLNIELFLRSI